MFQVLTLAITVSRPPADLPIRWPSQLTFKARALMRGMCRRHYVHGVPRKSSAGEQISLTFRRLLRAPTP